ncbi:MAG: galactokinase [Gemmatimonas sp.]|nr:galactokinase [Gemmatimonas sp.]
MAAAVRSGRAQRLHLSADGQEDHRTAAPRAATGAPDGAGCGRRARVASPRTAFARRGGRARERGRPGHRWRGRRGDVGTAGVRHVVRGARVRSARVIADGARRHFAAAFGGEPTLVASAAGRVNLIGEHVDYSGGEALPIAIQRRTAVAVRLRSGAKVTRINSGGTGGVLTIDHARLARRGKWTDYPSGVLDQLVGAGIEVPGLEVAVASDIPSGSGLSSSAALEVAFGFAVRSVLQVPLDAVLLALECQRAERQFVGVPCGAMDQLTAACGRRGHALHLQFGPIQVRAVPFAEQVLVVDTAVPRGLRTSAYTERVQECAVALAAVRQLAPDMPHLAAAMLEQIDRAEMPDVSRLRARHVIAECQRVRDAAAALSAGERFPGHLALASHQSLRDDYECSSRELDWVVEFAMRTPGIAGARLTGAGWGGCAVVFGDAGALAALEEALPGAYAKAIGHRPRAWLVTADDGARLE